MKPVKTRLTAVLIALLMAMSLLPAVAETTAPAPTELPPMAKLLSSGQAMQVELHVETGPSLPLLLSMMNTEPQPQEESDKVMHLISAINKLRITLVANQNAFSGVVGTELGELFDFQGTINEETLEQQVTSNLMPGIILSVVEPKEEKPLNLTPEMMEQLAQPYQAAFQEFSAGLMANATREEGSFEMDGYGSFTAKTPVTLTGNAAADFIEKVMGIYQQDTALQGVIQQLSEAAEGTDEVSQPAPEEMAESVMELVASLRKEGDKPILMGELYEGEGRSLSVFTTPQAPYQPTLKIDVYHAGEQGSLKLLMKNPVFDMSGDSNVDMEALLAQMQEEEPAMDETAPELEGAAEEVAETVEELAEEAEEAVEEAAEAAEEALEEATEAAEEALEGLPEASDAPEMAEDMETLLAEMGVEPELPIDWIEVEKSILDGSNKNDNMLVFQFANSKELTLNNSVASLNAYTGDSVLGLSLNSTFDSQAMTAQVAIGLSMNPPEPLVTLHISMAPSASQPLAPVTDGAATVVFDDDLSPEETALVNASTGKSAPLLMDKLAIALPEESSTLITLLFNLLAPPSMMPEPAPAPSTENP